MLVIQAFFLLSGRKYLLIFRDKCFTIYIKVGESASTSKPRFTRFNERRKATKEMQTCAASYSWLSNAAKMNTYLMRHAWKKYTAPMLIIQAEQDDYVWTSQIQKFADKIKKHGIAECEYLYLSETKLETYSSI